jgi:hypothetical protein
MKDNKLQGLLIVACCFVTALWTEIQGMERTTYDDVLGVSNRYLNYTYENIAHRQGHVNDNNITYYRDKPIAELLLRSGEQRYINTALLGFFWSSLRLYREGPVLPILGMPTLNLLASNAQIDQDWRTVIYEIYDVLINRRNGKGASYSTSHYWWNAATRI